MKIGQYNIQFHLIATIVVILSILFLINLGQWQLNRAELKKEILKDVEIRKTSAPLSLELLDDKEDKNYYHVKLKGRFDNEHYLLLDNRFYKSKPGFEVIQPLISHNRVILVNRGWIPLPLDRNNLPAIPSVTAEIQIDGEVNIPGKAIVLKADQLSAKKSWPQLIQSIDIKALTQLYSEIDMKVDPWVLRQDPDDDPFYRREWLFFSLKPEQHYAYAATWFGLAFILLIIYIAAVTKREDP